MTARFENGYALLIGVDENTDSRLALPVVARDVAALELVLTDPDVCAYKPEQVRVVTSDSATRDGIFQGLDWLRSCLAADDSENATAVVYYSGHGWRDTKSPNHYLIPYDIDIHRPHRSALPAREFAKEIAGLVPRRLLVMLDCCHAHGMGVKDLHVPGYVSAAFPLDIMGAGPDAVTSANGSKGLETLQQGTGRAILASSRGYEKSYYFPDHTMSIFTYHLIEALTGHAQTSAGHAEVLVSDVLGYLARQVPQTAREQCSKAQNPDFTVSGNFPVAMLLGGKGLETAKNAPDARELVRQAALEARRHADEGNRGGNRFGNVRGHAAVGNGHIQVGSVRSGGHVVIGSDNQILSRRDHDE